jgi:hypothetical protein
MEYPSLVAVLNDPLVLRYLLLHADFNSIIRFCQTYDLASAICSDSVFWAQKANHDFNTNIQDFYQPNVDPKQRYLNLKTIYDAKVKQFNRLTLAIDTLRAMAVSSGKVPITQFDVVLVDTKIVDNKYQYTYDIRVAYQVGNQLIWKTIIRLTCEDKEQVYINIMKNLADQYGINQDV